jgi:hypothetical protein
MGTVPFFHPARKAKLAQSALAERSAQAVQAEQSERRRRCKRQTPQGGRYRKLPAISTILPGGWETLAANLAQLIPP